MKKYRLYYININSGAEFSIEVDSNNEILTCTTTQTAVR